MNQKFPKSARLLTTSEFRLVHSSPYFAADAVLVVKGIKNEMDATRLGLSVSRKVGNAVVRNRWKRIIRDVFRTQRKNLPHGYDIVVRPKRNAICSYAGISRSLPRLIKKIEQKIQRDPSA